MPIVQLRPHYAFFTAIQYEGVEASLPPNLLEVVKKREEEGTLKIQAGDWFVDFNGTTGIYDDVSFHEIFEVQKNSRPKMDDVDGVLRAVTTEAKSCENTECCGGCQS